jgi:L-lactate dehydrogenase complex protein LldG
MKSAPNPTDTTSATATHSASVQARHHILQKLRQAAPKQPLPQPSLQAYLTGPYGVGSQGNRPSPLDLVSPFVQAAQGWRAQVLHCTSSNVHALVTQTLIQKGCQRVAVGSPAWLTSTAAKTLQMIDVTSLGVQFKSTLFNEVDAGISLACAGIADTGTLVLQSSPEEPRMLSLVPPISVVVLKLSDLYPSLPAAMQALQPQGHMPTNLLLVTGPSKTADIQQTLAYGAHGPKELVIALVDDMSEGAV